MPELTTYDEGTMTKVHEALRENGYLPDDIPAVISSFQNRGILFRERTVNELRQVGWQINGGPNDGLLVKEPTEEHKQTRHGGFSPIYVEVGE